MIEIVFVTHSTTFDNEAGVASGWNDVELSPLGIEQARELGARYRHTLFAAIFCSDLQRSYKTAELAFCGRFPVFRDARLRECNYGDFNGHPADEVMAEKLRRIQEPFPNGESYQQAAARMKSFLDGLKGAYDGERILIIGHRATHYGLDHWILGKPLEEVISAPWDWQPGWQYWFSSSERT